nr:UDP-2,3-diacylglucosamine diphosphatase [Gammaproteobacteria bacterium]
DFLIGDAFADRCNLSLLKQDSYLYEDSDIRLLLMHGDTLCTDDQEYQDMRATFRDDGWQQAFLAKSIGERRDYAQALRAQSRSRSADKPSDITDVNEATVIEVMEQVGVSQLLHGHTHRPQCHDVITRAGESQRWVLGDWHADHAVYAVLDRGVITLETFR